jgi:signal transduction histidine kinase
VRRRWRRLSLRRRIVISSSLLSLVVLVIGTVAVAAVFAAGRIRDIDTQTRAEADTLAALVATGQVPAVLPVPAGSPLLAQVLAADGTVLGSTPSASPTQALIEVRIGNRDVDTDEGGGYSGAPLRIRRVRASLAGQPVTIVVAAPLGDIRRALRSLRDVLVVVVPLLVLGAAVVVWWAAGRALRPVERLRAAAEELAGEPSRDGDLRRLPEQPGDDEIARLSRTLNGLLGALGQVLQRQTAFVADAAHELRSPLASLQVQLEVAAEHPELVDLPELLAELRLEAARLISLADDLLTLARLDVGPDLASRPLDLTALSGAVGPTVLVVGDEAALRRLVDNLLVNAHRHGSLVEVHTSVEQGFAVLDVDDNGPGIPPADRARVFDRWVRLDASRSRPNGGAGLGLGLARDIARAHGGDVAVLDSPLGGARLQVRLPLASG